MWVRYESVLKINFSCFFSPLKFFLVAIFKLFIWGSHYIFYCTVLVQIICMVFLLKVTWIFLKKILFIFLETGKGREKEGKKTLTCERNIGVLPLAYPQVSTWPATQACALTRN